MMSRYEELRSFLLTRMTSQDTNLRVLLFPPQHEEGWICVRGDLQFWAVVRKSQVLYRTHLTALSLPVIAGIYHMRFGIRGQN